MEDYFDIYYTRPDEMIGASRPKQNYAMHRQMCYFENEIRRADRLFSVKRLYRELRGIIPGNVTVNSIKALREVLANAPPSWRQGHSEVFFKTFFEYLEYLRRLADTFRERVYTVLYEFFYDASFLRLRDLHVKTGGLVKGRGQGISPDLVGEVGGLCRQLSFNIDALEDTANCLVALLSESEIDPNLFDDNSEHSILEFKDCRRFRNVLRLVPDVLNKSRMCIVLARAWWYKAEKIRRKLSGYTTSDSGVSSASDLEASSGASNAVFQKPKKQQGAANDHPIAQRPTLFRKKKVKNLEEMDIERMSHVQKPMPPSNAANPQNQQRSKKSKASGGKRDRAEEGTTEEELPHNDQSFVKRHPKKPTDRAPTYKGLNQKSQPVKADLKSKDSEEREGLEQDKSSRNQEIDPRVSKQPKKNRPRMGNPTEEKKFQKDDHSQENEVQAKAADVSTKKSKKKRGRDDGDKNPRSRSQDDINGEQSQANDGAGTGNARGKRKPPVQLGSQKVLHKSMDELSLTTTEPEINPKEEEPYDPEEYCWHEKILEKLRQRLEDLIECKETQQAALKLLMAMKDNLARETDKYRGSYRLKRRLQARVSLLMGKAQGWKEETKRLDYQHKLLAEDLRLDMKLHGHYCRFINVLRDRIEYLNSMVAKERSDIEELERQLGNLKETTDHLIHYGYRFDRYFDDFELDGWRGHLHPYGCKCGASLPPYISARFLRDEELLLGRSLQSKYERSIWDALKREPLETMALTSPEDSFSLLEQSFEDDREEVRGFRGRRDPGKGYQGDDDSTSESDYDDGDRDNKKQPQMYDQKRDDMQPPPFVPI